MTDRELMQMALNALEHLQTDIEWQYKSPTRAMLRKVEKALRARLAQPEPEPVAWMVVNGEGKIEQTSHYKPECERWLKYDPTRRLVPLYTTSPQREWQGLTDEEMFSLWVRCPAETEDRFAFARVIEQALKEKNNAN